MTIEERAKSFAKSRGINFAIDMRIESYTQGATDQREIDIEKACKWIDERCAGGVHPSLAWNLSNEFRKAMEE